MWRLYYLYMVEDFAFKTGEVIVQLVMTSKILS